MSAINKETMAVTLKNVTKKFNDFTAVNDISMTITEGIFFSLLGPSGCGKTTLLRMIAGFETPTQGDILFGDKSVVHIPAEQRNIGMVFQNYALFPHMNVCDNIAYGLKMRKVTQDLISDKLSYYTQLMGLQGLEKRMPYELSGGQQQRVALTRALITDPFLLLLDEPLSNLDVKLREEIREELMRIKLETKITTVYVTHDQSEALYLADQIAVMKTGTVQQLDSPKNIYHHPQNTYIATFVGETNILKSDFLKQYLDKTEQKTSVSENEFYSLRLEALKLQKDADTSLSFFGEVKSYRFYGMYSSLEVLIDEVFLLKAIYFNTEMISEIKVGENITLYYDETDLIPVQE